MKTQLVFKLEKQPLGYGQTFAPDCKVKILNTKGHVYLDYNRKWIMGSFENLRQEGEIILADVELFKNNEVIEHRLEYAVEGAYLDKNDKGEITSIAVKGVGALMPPTD